LSSTEGGGVGDFGVFEELDVEFLELVLGEGSYVGWNADEELGTACDLWEISG